MRLSTHTDFGLRLLMLGAEATPGAISVGAIAAQLQVSRHHLMKVAQNLARGGLMEPVRGRAGGFRLARTPEEIRLGDAVRCLETEVGLVECMRSSPANCPLIPGCRLPRLFREATDAFFDVLDQRTLADLVQGTSPLIRLVEAR
jgi:Rrf2 family nitric oxide-sensitive transcriptional repressor